LVLTLLCCHAVCCVQNPVGVAIGATAGHAAATALAVAGGALAGKYISEKTVNYISGALFLLFAAATVYTMM
jgi:putative Ca2+/H+ antiporter (TMEM165/GDT1 family)